jgi:hypothetical protein
MNILCIFEKTIQMKKLLLLLFVGALGFTACKKDKPAEFTSQDYANRLNGTWSVEKLNYSATFTFLGSPIPINGEATNSGTITFNSSTRFCDYNIKFLPNVPIPIDSVELVGAGTWTNTTNSITILDTATQQTLSFSTTVNEANVQQISTVVNYQLDSATTIPVTLNIFLKK